LLAGRTQMAWREGHVAGPVHTATGRGSPNPWSGCGGGGSAAGGALSCPPVYVAGGKAGTDPQLRGVARNMLVRERVPR